MKMIQNTENVIEINKVLAALCTSQWNTPHPPTRGTAGH